MFWLKTTFVSSVMVKYLRQDFTNSSGGGELEAEIEGFVVKGG